MTAPPDCDPTWHDHPEGDTPPPPGLLRLQEIHDLRAQGIDPYALHTMTTIPTQEYL